MERGLTKRIGGITSVPGVPPTEVKLFLSTSSCSTLSNSPFLPSTPGTGHQPPVCRAQCHLRGAPANRARITLPNTATQPTLAKNAQEGRQACPLHGAAPLPMARVLQPSTGPPENALRKSLSNRHPLLCISLWRGSEGRAASLPSSPESARLRPPEEASLTATAARLVRSGLRHAKFAMRKLAGPLLQRTRGNPQQGFLLLHRRDCAI
jgi:hypothetical protein